MRACPQRTVAAMDQCLAIDHMPTLVRVLPPPLSPGSSRRLAEIREALLGEPLGDGPALIALSATPQAITVYEAGYSSVRLISGGEKDAGLGMLGVKLWLEQDGRVIWQRRAAGLRDGGRWDLAAAGGVDPSEDIAEAALREAEEELGVAAADISYLEPLLLVVEAGRGPLIVLRGVLAHGVPIIPEASEVDEIALLAPGVYPDPLASRAAGFMPALRPVLAASAG